MITQRMNPTVTNTLLATTALCGLLAVVTINNPGDTATAAVGMEPSQAVVEVLPDLGEPATPADKLPPFLAKGPQVLEGSVPDSARFLGVDSGVRHWSALNTAGEICLISLLPGKGQMAAMSCAPPQDVVDTGLGLQVSDADVAVRAFVVPEGYVPSAPGFKKIDPNLIVESADVDMVSTVLEPRSEATSSDPIQLPQFPAASDFGE